MRDYKSAPLPFMGQKRNFLKRFKDKLKDYPEDALYVDLFGGSGLLSHTVKSIYPKATVIYNDYDNYQDRLKSIDVTNSILEELRNVLEAYPKEKRIIGSVKKDVLAILECYDKKGVVDYITLSSSLLFSTNYAFSYQEFCKKTLYNCIRKNNYDATGYLEGVTIVRMDYRALWEQYKNVSNVVFLVDPPYLQTTSESYKNYWKLSDYLNVLDVLQTPRFFYFTSNKSSILELCEWIETRSVLANPFREAQREEISQRVNYASGYTDIMLFK